MFTLIPQNPKDGHIQEWIYHSIPKTAVLHILCVTEAFCGFIKPRMFLLFICIQSRCVISQIVFHVLDVCAEAMAVFQRLIIQRIKDGFSVENKNNMLIYWPVFEAQCVMLNSYSDVIHVLLLLPAPTTIATTTKQHNYEPTASGGLA